MKKRSMSSDSSSKTDDRKTVEKNRRIHMKGLCFKLAALIPHHYFKSSKEMISQQDQVGHAISYISHLRERVEGLNDRKERATSSKTGINNMMIGSTSAVMPMFELRDLGSIIEVILISGLVRNFMLCEVVSILEQEGAEVVTASLTTVGEKVFQTIHAQVRISRLGVETSRINQRLQDLIY